MNCACGSESRVMETRARRDDTLRRVRKCDACGARFTTIEARVPPIKGGETFVLIVGEHELRRLRAGVEALRILLNPGARAESSARHKDDRDAARDLAADAVGKIGDDDQP